MVVLQQVFGISQMPPDIWIGQRAVDQKGNTAGKDAAQEYREREDGPQAVKHCLWLQLTRSKFIGLVPYVFAPVPDVKKVARQNEYSCIQSTFGVIFNPTPPSRSRVCRAPRVSQEATIRYQKIYVQALFV